MEIFQTIWTALTTENELLANLIVLPVNLLESIVNTLIFTTVLNINISKKQRLKYILIITSMLYLTSIFIPNPYKFFVNLIVIILSIHFILNVSFLKSIICLIIPTLLAIISESLLIKLCMHFFNYDITTFTTYPLYKFLISLSIQILVFLIYLIIKYFKIQFSILENMQNKNKTIFIANFSIAIVTITVQFFIAGFYIEKLPVYIVILSNLTLVTYLLFSLYSLSKSTQLELTTLNLEQEKEHNRILKLAQDDIRGFRHDFTNIICTIGGYVHTKDMEGLTNYYNQIQKDVVKVNNLTALNPDIINNPAIYALITSKYDKAADLNISMSVEVFTDLNSLPMKIYEFTRILGILLDNAIEAAQECDEKNVYIHIRKDEKHNRQLLIVENTYKDKTIDTDKIFEKNYSTKPKNTGLGLWEVRQILKRNNNLNLYTTKNEKLFKQQLEIYNI